VFTAWGYDPSLFAAIFKAPCPFQRASQRASIIDTIQAHIILLDSSTHCAQGDIVRCEAPLTVLSLALPDPYLRDRFSSLRRSDARVSLNGCMPCLMVCWSIAA